MLQHRNQQLTAICAIFVVFVFSMCRKRTETIPVTVLEEHHSFIAVPGAVTESFGGYYVALPPRYDARIDKFPLLVFLHGLGQMGNGDSELSYLTFDGIGKLIHDQKFPVSFSSEGKLHSFIVVSPQSSRQPSPEEVQQLTALMIERYRVDTTRLYLSGLSMGAKVVTLTAAQFPEQFAAVVPIAGVATGAGLIEKCQRIAESGLPLWEFHNVDDPMADVSQAKRFIETLSGFNPRVPPRFTIFDVYGHDAWTTALDPAYKEDGTNIYEWMLKYSR